MSWNVFWASKTCFRRFLTPLQNFAKNNFWVKKCSKVGFFTIWGPKTSKKRDFEPTLWFFFKKLVGPMTNRFQGGNVHVCSRLLTAAFGEIIFLSLQIRSDVLTKLKSSENSLKVSQNWAQNFCSKSKFWITPKWSLNILEGSPSILECFLSFSDIFSTTFDSHTKFREFFFLSQKMLESRLFALLRAKNLEKTWFWANFVNFFQRIG